MSHTETRMFQHCRMRKCNSTRRFDTEDTAILTGSSNQSTYSAVKHVLFLLFTTFRDLALPVVTVVKGHKIILL